MRTTKPKPPVAAKGKKKGKRAAPGKSTRRGALAQALPVEGTFLDRRINFPSESADPSTHQNPLRATGNNVKRDPNGKNNGGRPNGYLVLGAKLSENPVTIPELVERMCAAYGCTNLELARFFGVSVANISQWRTMFAEFDQSIKKGCDTFDSLAVERSALLRSALGYITTEYTRELKPVNGGGGNGKSVRWEMVTTKEVTREIAPNVTACIYWLGNRHPERWRHVQNPVAHRGEGTLVQDNSKHLHLHQEAVRSRVEEYKNLYTREELEQLRELLERVEKRAIGPGAGSPAAANG